MTSIEIDRHAKKIRQTDPREHLSRHARIKETKRVNVGGPPRDAFLHNIVAEACVILKDSIFPWNTFALPELLLKYVQHH